MSEVKLNVWVTREFPRTWTHIVGGDFVNPQSATQNVADLFCYDRNSGFGALFATVRNGRLDDGTLVVDGPRQIGPSHTFGRRWTHIARAVGLGVGGLLFYDAPSGVAEVYQIDVLGNLILKARHTGLRTSWTLIVAGRFGRANLLFYDAANGTGEFYSTDNSGGMRLVRSVNGWRNSWHTILPGNFSSSPRDDLLFYDQGAGSAEFYRLDENAGMTMFSEHDNWRTTWQYIVPGQFSTATSFDSLLFYEEGTRHTEFFSTNGRGSLSQIDVDPGTQWALPWQAILAATFTPNLGLHAHEDLIGYDPRDGAIRIFYFVRGNS